MHDGQTHIVDGITAPFDKAEAGGRGWKGEPRPRIHGPRRGHRTRRRDRPGDEERRELTRRPFELEVSPWIHYQTRPLPQPKRRRRYFLTSFRPAYASAPMFACLLRTHYTLRGYFESSTREQALFTCRGTQSHASCNFPRHWKTVAVVSCSFIGHVSKGASAHQQQARGAASVPCRRTDKCRGTR